MEQTQTQTQIPSRYTIDTKKLEKYLPKLLNGEANKLATWLPNLLSTGGIVARETYDYRLGQFRKKDSTGFNSKFAVVVQRLEAMRRDRDLVVEALAELKMATDCHHEKNKQLRF